MIKPSTKYLIVVEIKENTLNIDVNFDSYGTALNSFTAYLSFNSNEVGIKKVVITTPSTIDSTKNGLFRMPINVPNEGSILKFRVMAIEYQEGMENWDIPYFEGMQSVKLPVLTTVGKNLFDGYLEKGWSSTDGSLIDMDRTRTNLIFVEKNKSYTVSRNQKITVKMDEFDEQSNFVKNTTFQGLIFTFTTSTNTKYIRILIADLVDNVKTHNLQLEEGTVATSYEPYKSNILSCLEPVELGSVGEVKDELNLLTQQLTQRTETRPYQEGDELNSEFVTDMTNTRYKLAQEVVKTVDLTTVDQDGQPTKLKTFNDITYVEINADPIIPSVNVEVATKIRETLSTLGLDHHELSNTQDKLGQTIDEQTENTDATMMATTEIYEQTL